MFCAGNADMTVASLRKDMNDLKSRNGQVKITVRGSSSSITRLAARLGQSQNFVTKFYWVLLVYK
jgi:hypothetical protein